MLSANIGQALYNSDTGRPAPFGTATLINCTITGNSTSFATAVWNAGTLNLINCSISGNSATSIDPGIYSAGTATLINCVLWADGSPEIDSSYGSAPHSTVTLTHCDIEGGIDEPGLVDDGGNISADPLLGQLADNGGLIQTMALDPGSPVIAAGTSIGAPLADQRHFARLAPPSIGA